MRKGEPSPFRGERAFNFKHGLEGTRFCNIFRRIKDRCENPNYVEFHLYGGRGIKCEWPDLLAFKNEMYSSYLAHVEEFGEANTSIDRFPNVNGNYSKDNCRWATPKQQARNKRNNRFLEFKGQRKTMVEWAEEAGLTIKQVHKRLRLGWDVERTLTTKIKQHERKNG